MDHATLYTVALLVIPLVTNGQVPYAGYGNFESNRDRDISQVRIEVGGGVGMGGAQSPT